MSYNRTRPKISISELYELRNKKIEHRVNSFDIVLEKAHKRMRTAAANGGLNVFFEVPNFIIGVPLYNFEECIIHIVDALRKGGFLVQMLEQNHGLLYISWDQQEIAPSKKPKAIERRTPADEPSVQRTRDDDIMASFSRIPANTNTNTVNGQPRYIL